MALNYLNCKVCGKEYKACNPIGIKSNRFRWQAVACSPECGEIYLERFLSAKAETPKQEVVSEPELPEVVELYIPNFDDEDEIDEDFELEDEE